MKVQIWVGENEVTKKIFIFASRVDIEVKDNVAQIFFSFFVLRFNFRNFVFTSDDEVIFKIDSELTLSQSVVPVPILIAQPQSQIIH